MYFPSFAELPCPLVSSGKSGADWLLHLVKLMSSDDVIHRSRFRRMHASCCIGVTTYCGVLGLRPKYGAASGTVRTVSLSAWCSHRFFQKCICACFCSQCHHQHYFFCILGAASGTARMISVHAWCSQQYSRNGICACMVVVHYSISIMTP